MIYDPKKISGKNHRDLEALHPKVAQLAAIFVKNANGYLAEKGLEVRVTSTLRTWQEQQDIYNQGRTKSGLVVTNAKPGDSIHNWGCAFDTGIFKAGEYLDGAVKKDEKGKVVADKVKQKLAFDTHTDISKIAKKIGLFWGGDFISIKDNPHYQYTGKTSNNDFIRLAKAGKSIDELLGE